VFLRNQINLSVQMLALAAECVVTMKGIIFVPILNLCALVTFLVPCMTYFFYVASDGTIETNYVNGVPVGKVYHPEPGVVDRLWYLFFCFLWTMSWIGGMASIAIAISCATWYFAEDRSQINSFTILRAYSTTIRYHWGTAAFGSLLIAIVQFIRAFLLYIERHFKSVIGANCLLKVVVCCVNCCLYCLEKCVKFIAKHAYIQTAIHVKVIILLHYPSLVL
jgi:choline transporter-like protein 2/4/5